MAMPTKSILAVACAVFALALPAAHAARALGPTYPILEPDMLQEIDRTLREKEKSGELAKKQEEAKQRSQEAITNPKPVEGLRRTHKARTFYFDPSIVANQTITTPDGKVLVPAGQKLNPLDQMAMTQWLVFFDGRDPAQVAKAEQLYAQAQGKAKLILTGGSFIELQKRWKRQVYFDQRGSLVRKFGIQQVPAIVKQEGKRLRIDELEM